MGVHGKVGGLAFGGFDGGEWGWEWGGGGHVVGRWLKVWWPGRRHLQQPRVNNHTSHISS